MGLGANDDDDVAVDDVVSDGGECNSSGKCFGSLSCSICLDLITDNGDRSWAKLQCGHQFHFIVEEAGDPDRVFFICLILPPLWPLFFKLLQQSL
ncbi:hypothetical protein Patl1_00001 [Pistacia atlantica]|uniref:Uncharacterized protein n=1 Tax=Pistacia atlantica TaxID=434234 RepID=A0ACC1CBQ8_9ROSI|nr:hypothetical protein Patl1_00001 [Pistacia atlantica]